MNVERNTKLTKSVEQFYEITACNCKFCSVKSHFRKNALLQNWNFTIKFSFINKICDKAVDYSVKPLVC